ncbi:MAG: glutamate--tRNA ligase, partial [Campylobacterales bacterium]|nr:glutamate--tRNA ligase [Campylobacterales bacterium]
MLRFAITPTGDMHINHLRNAILHYIVAHQKKEAFGVRIDHNEQNIAGKDEEILMILEKFALPYSQLLYQKENAHIHQTLAIGLLQENKAFLCLCATHDCTAQCDKSVKAEIVTLKEAKTPFVLRLKKPQNDTTITTTPKEVDSFVILQNQGIPTYPFACACDDMLHGVTHIIDSQHHLNSTLTQHAIRQILGYDTPIVSTHLPDILNGESILIKNLLKEGY